MNIQLCRHMNILKYVKIENGYFKLLNIFHNIFNIFFNQIQPCWAQDTKTPFSVNIIHCWLLLHYIHLNLDYFTCTFLYILKIQLLDDKITSHIFSLFFYFCKLLNWIPNPLFLNLPLFVITFILPLVGITTIAPPPYPKVPSEQDYISENNQIWLTFPTHILI